MMRTYAKLITSKRKNRLKVIEGYHTKEQWEQLCSFFKKVCPRCDRQKKKLTKDHIIPVTWSSSTAWISNFQPLCPKCNREKSNHSAIDYRPEHVKQWAEKEKEKLKK